MSGCRLFGAALALAVALAPGAAAAPASGHCDTARFRTIIDVGHTPEVPGAISARGVPEYEFNLRLSRRIERELLTRGFARTRLLLTRGEARPGLYERVARANASKAHLFLSVHHDSVPDFLIQNWEFLGAEGRHNDNFKGHSIFVSADHPQYARSKSFARALGLTLRDKGLAYTPHYTESFMRHRRRALVDREAGVYRFDRLMVLMYTQMPAVLLEAGSIINRDEELALQSPERQAMIAEAVADAVESFCGRRTRMPRQIAG
jgi:N-acetylmuramoyl-L-alanine amidase